MHFYCATVGFSNVARHVWWKFIDVIKSTISAMTLSGSAAFVDEACFGGKWFKDFLSSDRKANVGLRRSCLFVDFYASPLVTLANK